MSVSGPIFIVDDDDGHAYLMETNLRESGVINEIVRFASGDEVLDHLYGSEPVPLPILILLDLNMPGTNGRRVLERIKSQRSTKSIPIVILTTTADPPEIEACYELGCNFYLTKPIQYEEFVKVIRLLGLVFQIVKLPGAGTQGGLLPEI